MKFRLARHTHQLAEIHRFYHDILGLDCIGSFEDHAGYDGRFYAFPNSNWEIEFTSTKEKPVHHPDPDDLLVFYFDSEYELSQKIRTLESNGYQAVPAKNPYWNDKGKLFLDPDGFGIILTSNSSH